MARLSRKLMQKHYKKKSKLFNYRRIPVPCPYKCNAELYYSSQFGFLEGTTLKDHILRFSEDLNIAEKVASGKLCEK